MDTNVTMVYVRTNGRQRTHHETYLFKGDPKVDARMVMGIVKLYYQTITKFKVDTATLNPGTTGEEVWATTEPYNKSLVYFVNGVVSDSGKIITCNDGKVEPFDPAAHVVITKS